jgi:hypothetical protein
MQGHASGPLNTLELSVPVYRYIVPIIRKLRTDRDAPTLKIIIIFIKF